jgi:membrane protease YdiL (CAAX protease family)
MTTLLEFAARGRTAWWRYLVATALALVIATVLSVVLIVALMSAHLFPPDLANQLQRPTRPLTFFVATGLEFGLLLIGFVLAIRLVQAKRFSDIVGDWSWRSFAWACGIWAGFQLLSTLADFLIAPRGFSVSATSSTAILAISAFAGLAVQTFTEEFVFRGYLTQAMLLATRRPLVAATVSGMLFGALHIPNGLVQAFGAMAFGVSMSLVTIRTGGIAISCGLHIVNNLFGAVVVVSASDVFRGAPGLFTQNTPQLAWWDASVEIAALVAIVWLVQRRSNLMPSPALGGT